MVQKTTRLAISLVLAACAGPLAYFVTKVHKTGFSCYMASGLLCHNYAIVGLHFHPSAPWFLW